MLSTYISEENYNKYLYHYTSEEVLINHILPEKRLRFSPFYETNDPHETKSWHFSMSDDLEVGMESQSSKDFLKNQERFSDILKSQIKVLCFAQDNIEDGWRYGKGTLKPRMWAQYAKNHTGACIIFNRTKLIDDISKIKTTSYNGS